MSVRENETPSYLQTFSFGVCKVDHLREVRKEHRGLESGEERNVKKNTAERTEAAIHVGSYSGPTGFDEQTETD